MNIPRPPERYDRRVEDERNRIIEQADRENRKKAEHVRILDPYKLILASPDGTEWEIEVDNSGNIAATSL